MSHGSGPTWREERPTLLSSLLSQKNDSLRTYITCFVTVMKTVIYIIAVVWLLIKSSKVFRVIKCSRDFYGDTIHVSL
jgi:hypothetical protein